LCGASRGFDDQNALGACPQLTKGQLTSLLTTDN
jgi:hypothetical protein